jgi:integrase family protein with SAM-like domain
VSARAVDRGLTVGEELGGVSAEARVAGLRESELVSITVGHPLVDGYLEFVGARGATNTWLAVAYDLKVFFEVVAKEPAEVTAADVFAFLTAQRSPRLGERVVRIEDGEPGLAARTIARRLSSVAGLFEYLLARGDAGEGGSGAAWAGRPSRRAASSCRGAAGAHAAHVAAGAVALRGRPRAGRVADAPAGGIGQSRRHGSTAAVA